MKVKLTSLQIKHDKYEQELLGVKFGGIYEVVRHHESGGVIVKTENEKELLLFDFEFEVINEAE